MMTTANPQSGERANRLFVQGSGQNPDDAEKLDIAMGSTSGAVQAGNIVVHAWSSR